MIMGHLKPGVTPAQATADLNSIGADLEKTYPKDDRQDDVHAWRGPACTAIISAAR